MDDVAVRPTSPGVLKRAAWRALSKYVRAVEPNCVTCGGRPDHAGHFQYNTERNQLLGGNALWYDRRNIHSQCIECNNYKSGNTIPYKVYMINRYGSEIIQEIRTLWQTPKKWTREEIIAIEQYYTKAYKDLGLSVMV